MHHRGSRKSEKCVAHNGSLIRKHTNQQSQPKAESEIGQGLGVSSIGIFPPSPCDVRALPAHRRVKSHRLVPARDAHPSWQGQSFCSSFLISSCLSESLAVKFSLWPSSSPTRDSAGITWLANPKARFSSMHHLISISSGVV